MKNASNISILTRGIQSFPTLPAVVVRILELTADPDSALEDFISMIQCDPSLTTTVLKLSNSALYGQVRKVSTLKQAISVLGINEIRNVVVGRAVFTSFKRIKSSTHFDIRDFWWHSFICGLSANILAKEGPYSDDFFIAGLIHDIGKLVLITALPVSFLDIVKNNNEQAHEIFKQEERVFGISHAEIGMTLLKRWMFPDSLVVATGYHHRPENAEMQAHVAALIHFADILAHRNSLGENGSFETPMNDPLNAIRAKSAGITWNDEAFKGYLNILASRKEEFKDVFNMMYS